MPKIPSENERSGRGTLVFVPPDLAEKLKRKRAVEAPYDSFRSYISKILSSYEEDILVDRKMLRMEIEAEFGRSLLKTGKDKDSVSVKAFKPSAEKSNEKQQSAG